MVKPSVRSNVIGYVIMAVAIVVASFVFQQQQHAQDEFARKLAAYDARSCAAYKGAVAYWRASLFATNLLLDARSTFVERTARLKQREALTLVISRSAGLVKTCAT